MRMPYPPYIESRGVLLYTERTEKDPFGLKRENREGCRANTENIVRETHSAEGDTDT